MSAITRKSIANGVNFTYVHNTKFKTSGLLFSMFIPISEKNASKNAALCDMLIRSCKKYPSLLSVSRKLENLYGSSISSEIGKIADMQTISFCVQSIKDNFVPNQENVFAKTVDLLLNMIFEPDILSSSFKEENVNSEKRELVESIKAQYNDKRVYALKQCTKAMFKNEKYAIDSLGTVKDAEKLNSENIFEAWKELLSKCRAEIVMISSSACEPTEKKIKEKFSAVNRENVANFQNKIIRETDKIKEICEKTDVNQCKLVMGFLTKIAKPEKDVAAVKVMNALLGGTPQSKLFMNVREKLSLCYYCSSAYNSQKGIITIESGVEKENIEKAKKEILNQISEIKLGNFTDKELNETKMFISQKIQKTSDSLSTLASWYIFQAFDEKIKTTEEEIESINSVSREKIIEVANKITLDTVYMLVGKGE